MTTSPPELPDSVTLSTGLSSVLSADDAAAGPVTILNREPHYYASTYPIEVITCRTGTGIILRLLCKYSAEQDHSSHGHRGGLPYEAEVYRWVLASSEITSPEFHGAYQDPRNGWNWLILTYLDGAQRMRKTEDGPELAARWLARFHAANELRVSNPSLRFLARYHRGYYRSWFERAIQSAGQLPDQFSELSELARQVDDILDVLEAIPPTVLHGEYYGDNVLVRDGIVFPVDWESAAVGPAEIDLASLTEGWPEQYVVKCESAYCSTRWPAGEPKNFAQRLRAARIYSYLRRLGDSRGSITPEVSEGLRGEVGRW